MSTNATDTRSNNGESSPRRAGRRWWAAVRLVLLGVVLAGVTGVVVAFPLLPTERVALEAGDVAPRDIRAPRRVTYESAILRTEEQERAAAAVEPIYIFDPALARQQLGRAHQVFDYLGSVRADSLGSFAQKRGWILAVPELTNLSIETLDTLLALSDASWNRVQVETSNAIDQAMRREIREGNLENAREGVRTLIGLNLSNEEMAVTIALAQHFLVSNSFLDSAATAEAQARARDEVPPVLRTFEAEQIVVREGDRVKPLDIEALDQFGLRKSQVRWADLVGAGLLAILGTLLLGLYLTRFQPEVLWDGQKLLLLVLLTSFSVVATGMMVPGDSEVLRYLAPAPALAMLATAVLGPQAGVATALFLGGAAGVIAGNSSEMLVYTVLGGMAAALTMGRVEHISALFRAGAFAALAHVTVIVIFRLTQDTVLPSALLIQALAGIANGGIAASLALGGLYLVGPLFDITTTIRLIELSRPDNPLLQRLLREAPATYHHSLMVANLAEQAAERIGADPLLSRVGAYYHDVGKVTRPYFFAENQAEGVNPHDRLDPRTSAEVIISHVKDGLELARRYHLPRCLRAFIPEHHGTNWVSFLYSKAVQMAGDAALVDERDFRYYGPKPQSKETALVMLADGCEAAVGAMRPTSAEEVAEIVSRVVAERVADGQLDECDLTLRDLEMVRAALTSALKGVFHPRIQYPQSKGVGNT